MSEQHNSGIRVLVIDKSVDRGLLNTLLEKKVPFILCNNHVQAFDSLYLYSYDIVFININMAEVNGTEFLALVKTLRPEVEVIIMIETTRDDLTTSTVSSPDTKVHFMAKPVQPAIIKYLIAKKAKEKQEEGEYGKTRCNLCGYRLTPTDISVGNQICKACIKRTS